jgi:hypothetical protein
MDLRLVPHSSCPAACHGIVRQNLRVQKGISVASMRRFIRGRVPAAFGGAAADVRLFVDGTTLLKDQKQTMAAVAEAFGASRDETGRLMLSYTVATPDTQ